MLSLHLKNTHGRTQVYWVAAKQYTHWQVGLDRAAEFSVVGISESAFPTLGARTKMRRGGDTQIRRRINKQSGSCDPDCQSEGAKSEGQAEGALEDTRMTVHAADHAKNTWGLIHGGRRVGEVRMVGSIEGIPAELEGLSFCQSPVLHDR